MPSPLTVKRNDYHKRPKGSTVYTPDGVSRFLYDILHDAHPLRRDPTHGVSLHPFYAILDPAIGTGHLTAPWLHAHPLPLHLRLRHPRPEQGILPHVLPRPL